jgi:hypothetical protein
MCAKGMVWNKSHALNFGIRRATSSYILIGDIDLIYSSEAIGALLKQKTKNSIVSSDVYLLPKNMNRRKAKSTHGAYGAVLLVSRDILNRIRGFDEYYCFWGVEDRDMYNRLTSLLGMSCEMLDKKKYPIYHQWHSKASDRKRGFFPDLWWDDMNIYYALNENKLIRNSDDWGKILNENNRPILRAHEVTYEIHFIITKAYQKAEIYERIISSFMKLKEDECLSIVIHSQRQHPLLYKVVHFINTLLRKAKIPIGLEEITSLERERFFYPQHDIVYILWQLIKKEKVVRDYYIQNDKDCIIIKLMRERNTCLQNSAEEKIFAIK